MQSSWTGITYTLTTWWTRVVFHWNAHILGVRIERTPFFALCQKRVSPSGWGCPSFEKIQKSSPWRAMHAPLPEGLLCPDCGRLRSLPRAAPDERTLKRTGVPNLAPGHLCAMIAAMEIDSYWRTRTVAEAMKDYAFLRLTCECGRITDYPFTLLLQRKGSVGIASSAIFDFGVRVAEVRKSR